MWDTALKFQNKICRDLKLWNGNVAFHTSEIDVLIYFIGVRVGVRFFFVC